MRRSALLALLMVVGACGGDVAKPASGCADVVAAVGEIQADGAYTFEVSVRSADTGWEKYADAWEVRDPAGVVLGTRHLLHPHVDEQPFSRLLENVVIPTGVTTVVVAARDSVDGFCGDTMEINLP